MSYTHFTLKERKYLQQLLPEKKSFREIARILGRSPLSISREVRRNRTRWKPRRQPDNPFWYNCRRAQNLYIRRRREQIRMGAVPGSDAWNYIVSGLEKYRSPEAICGRWHVEHPGKKPLCASTIYRYIYQKQFPKISAKTHLRRRGKLFYPRNSNYNSIQPNRIIPEWPEEIRLRARIGDWEGDTVYGGIGKGFLVTQVDRRSRFLRAGLLAKRDALLTKDVICKFSRDFPSGASARIMVRSLRRFVPWRKNSMRRFILPSRISRGSAAQMKTQMTCCASFSRRALISVPSRRAMWMKLSTSLTIVPENALIGGPPPRSFPLIVLHLVDFLP